MTGHYEYEKTGKQSKASCDFIRIIFLINIFGWMKWINNIWPLNWMCPGRLLGNNGIWPLMKINDDFIKLNGFREKLDDTRAWKHQSVFRWKWYNVTSKSSGCYMATAERSKNLHRQSDTKHGFISRCWGWLLFFSLSLIKACLCSPGLLLGLIWPKSRKTQRKATHFLPQSSRTPV